MKKKNTKFSSEIVKGFDRAPSRAMLRGVGFKDKDFSIPQVGIASTWSEVTPCNSHINKLADSVSQGVEASNLKPVIFNTITISDGIYGSCFYMATGFHGFHVIVGTIFLIVCFFRLYLNHFTREHHIGFEAAA